ncbi:MAG: hypothetical protein ABSG88_16590 [Bradyrhizobium sp.]
MTAHSYSINRGQDGFRQSDFTHGTLAPNANDVELRVNTLDQNGANLTRKDIDDALKAFARAILDGTMFASDYGI